METRVAQEFAPIVGRTIQSVEVSHGETYLRISCSEGEPLILEAKGDCCSESWFADITGAAALMGGRVVDVEELEMPECDNSRTRQEEDIAYGYLIRTDQGDSTIAFRNSSNGYYGGGLHIRTEPPTERVDDDDVPVTWRNITEDWSA